jgi:hypothetical protein
MSVGFDHITSLLRGGKSYGGVNQERIPPAASMKDKLQREITLSVLRAEEKPLIGAEVNFLASDKNYIYFDFVFPLYILLT